MTLLLLAAVFLLSFIAASDAAAASAATAAADDEDWLSSCRRRGFDPYQLACSTCEDQLLRQFLSPSSLDTCLECCQSYKDVERIRRPYEAAVLITHSNMKPEGSSGGEIDQFLVHDWDKLVAMKGESRLTWKQERLDRIPSLQSGYYFFHLPVATLLFLDSKDLLDRKDVNVNRLVDQAREVIRLDGWKRDDIRDMLKALLP
jgi:hypothetical protein